jgi:hypothetical protein
VAPSDILVEIWDAIVQWVMRKTPDFTPADCQHCKNRGKFQFPVGPDQHEEEYCQADDCGWVEYAFVEEMLGKIQDMGADVYYIKSRSRFMISASLPYAYKEFGSREDWVNSEEYKEFSAREKALEEKIAGWNRIVGYEFVLTKR